MSGQSKHLFSTDPIIMQFNNLLGELVNRGLRTFSWR